MFKNFILSVFVLTTSAVFCAFDNHAPAGIPAKAPISHEIWNELLRKHVRPDGFVDYKGLVQDSVQLNAYLSLLSSAHPQESWSKAEQMAYWINAYNAFTIKLIVDHYPVKSIKDIKKGIPFVNTVWDKVHPDKAEISSIFNWFGGDFKEDAGSIRNYINRYAEKKLIESGKINYLEYKWSLNEAK